MFKILNLYHLYGGLCKHFHLLQVHVSAEMIKSDPHNKYHFGRYDI